MSLDLFSLTGKCALVTGASSGLGRAAAIALAQAGARVMLGSSQNIDGLRDTAQEIQAVGGVAEYVRVDVGDPVACGKLVDHCIERFGRLDILVNNAGMIERAPAVDHSLQSWERVMDVNARAVFLLTQHAGRHMLERGSGKIINIASLLSFQGGVNVLSYAASKGAVAQLTKAFANEWASRGVSVNAIAPGYIRTNNTLPLQNDPSRYQAILDRIPAGRWGEPADIAGAVVFLASRASDYVHGHILCVDGGWMGR